MVPMRAQKRKGAFHEPPVWIPGFSRSGPPEGGTPNKWRPTERFMVPMHAKKRKRAFHEPPVWSPGFSRSGPLEGGTPNTWHPMDRFMVPMHAQKRKEALHEPCRGRRKEAHFFRYNSHSLLRSAATVHGPKACAKRKKATHEPTVRSPGFSRSGPPEGGTPNKWRPTDGFMVPMRA